MDKAQHPGNLVKNGETLVIAGFVFHAVNLTEHGNLSRGPFLKLWKLSPPLFIG